MSQMRFSPTSDGMSMLEFDDGRTVDLHAKIRLTKTDASSSGKGFTCEGFLSGGMDASSEGGEPMRFHLLFFGGAKADWVPYLGDTIENVQ